MRGFGHALAGAGRVGIRIGFLEDSDTNLDTLIGGGLDVGVTEHFVVRVFQSDWLPIFEDGYSVDMLRLCFGLVGSF